MNISTAADGGASRLRVVEETAAGPVVRHRDQLHYMRASGLAQTRLQIAVLSGNRRRALEQIDRLVAIDQQLERIARGETPAKLPELPHDLADQRLAIATEKLALTSGIDLPRLEPAFGAGMTATAAGDDEVEIVEDGTLNRSALRMAGWALGLLALCFAITAAAMFWL